jgi:GDP-L-fucose synthase
MKARYKGMDRKAKIYVAGHRGLVGSAIVRKLQAEGYANLLCRTSAELDLRDQAAVAEFFLKERPDYVFLAAARVGGIVANNGYPAEFIYDNLQIQNNVIHQAWLTGVKRLLFLGSTCIYPKLALQPMKEEYLLTGPLEPTNEPYAIAKIAGITMCRSYNRQYGTRFLAAMPTNLYGPFDNFNLETSHVLPALVRKFHEAKAAGKPSVTIWGTGSPYREFLHVADLANASLFLMNLPDNSFDDLLFPGPQSPVPGPPALINIGTGEEVTIRELALLVKETVGFAGDLQFDATKPDGTPRKLSDVSRLHQLGWRHRISLKEGLETTYAWYKENMR